MNRRISTKLGTRMLQIVSGMQQNRHVLNPTSGRGTAARRVGQRPDTPSAVLLRARGHRLAAMRQIRASKRCKSCKECNKIVTTCILSAGRGTAGRGTSAKSSKTEKRAAISPPPSSPRHGSGTIALQILRALQRRQNLVETTGRRGAAAEKARRTGLTAPRRQKLKLLDMYTYKECFNLTQTHKTPKPKIEN
jgi:hypothetical protein